MNKALLFLPRILLLIGFIIGGYSWLTGTMDSLFTYRSPLKNNPPPVGEPVGAPLVRRVVFVVVDALRLDTSLKSEVMPNLNRLRQVGASASIHSQPPSFSQPGYATLLTGAWPDINDSPVINVEVQGLYPFTQDDIFSSAHRAGHKTALSAFNWFEKLIPVEAVDVTFSTPLEDQQADRQVVDAALPWLESNDYQFVLIHLDQVDYAGHHEGGPRDPRWDAAAKRADDLLGELLETLDLSKDAILVVSDHGQIDQGGHGGQDAIVLLEPFLLAGRGIKPGQYGDANMVDVAPTLAALLGASLPASSQGRVLTEMLDIHPQLIAYINALSAEQQIQLVSNYRQAVLPENTSLTSIDAVRQARLTSERLPRAVISLFILSLPATFLFWKRNRGMLWLVGGALIYTTLFHTRFILLDGRAYSLSSLEGVEQAISYFGTTVLISFLIASIAFFICTKPFNKSPQLALISIMDLALCIIFLLAIPVLFSYFLNGWQAVWTLPEFNSTMVAFINGMQILFIGAVGLLLAGLWALVSFLRLKIRN